MKRTGFATRQRTPMKRTGRLRPKRRKPGVTGRPSLDRQAWNLLKQTLWLRAKGRCEHCRRASDLDAHHVTKRSQGGADALENLVALCRRCHDQTDAPYAKGRLVVSSDHGTWRFQILWQDPRTASSVSVSLAEQNGAGGGERLAGGRSRRHPNQHPVIVPPSKDLYPTVPQRRGR